MFEFIYQDKPLEMYQLVFEGVPTYLSINT